MRYKPSDHTFVICAYKSSPYLEDCIRSLKLQSVHSSIIITTSTPSEYISDIADRNGIEVFINHASTGIASDWNYSLKCVKTKLATIAHQDDLYEPDFLKYTLRELNKGGNSIMAFTSYYEIQNNKKITSKSFINLRIKEWMLKPLTFICMQKSRAVRRCILSLADPICCPSVTYVKRNLPKNLFSSEYKAVLDWHAWEHLSRGEGRFAYIDRPLVGHRMYSDSTTMKMIENHERSKEDLMIYRLFWPEPIAQMIDRLYSLSQISRKKHKADEK